MKGIMRKSIRTVLAGTALIAAVTVFGMSGRYAYAATVTVTDKDSCRIRKDASTSSEVVSSVASGKTLEVISEKTGSDGYTWYEVKVEGSKTGYIRADLVSTPDGNISGSTSQTADTSSATATSGTGDTSAKSDSSTTTKTSTASATQTSSAAETEVVDSNALTATVSADTVTVREGASTKTNKKGSAKSGQELYINGEATDADGKLWYKISFEADGKTVEGFIRSDFLEVTSTLEDIESTEPEADEAAAAESTPTVSNDYEVRYEANSEGIDEWFLYDHINGTKQSINNIHAVMEQSQNMVVDDGGEVKTMKIVIIVMAVIMLLLIIAIAILLLKLRDSYEDFDDIDDGYEDEDEEEDIEDEEYENTGRNSAKGGGRRFGLRNRRRDYDDYEDEEDDDGDDEDAGQESEVYTRPVKRTSRASSVEPSGRAVAGRRSEEVWSSKSLMDIDDDMEFEFLDLDN